MEHGANIGHGTNRESENKCENRLFYALAHVTKALAMNVRFLPKSRFVLAKTERF
jgi:hypothetical protein